MRARREAGGWGDILVCGEVIDRQRATGGGCAKIGRDLQRIAARAIELVLEDARNGNGRLPRKRCLRARWPSQSSCSAC